jgi:hypothetical protein
MTLETLTEIHTLRQDSIDQLWARTVEWEDTVRKACREAIPISQKEFAPTMAQIAKVLGISEKTLQHVRRRPDGTAAWPRPTDLAQRD